MFETEYVDRMYTFALPDVCCDDTVVTEVCEYHITTIISAVLDQLVHDAQPISDVIYDMSNVHIHVHEVVNNLMQEMGGTDDGYSAHFKHKYNTNPDYVQAILSQYSMVSYAAVFQHLYAIFSNVLPGTFVNYNVSYAPNAIMLRLYRARYT